MAPRRRKAYIKITIDGEDVTSKWSPYLITVSVRDQEFATDEATITLDDSYAQLRLPSERGKVVIQMGWPDEGVITVFRGVVVEVESHFTRRGGRILTVEAWSMVVNDGIKSQVNMHHGDGRKEVT